MAMAPSVVSVGEKFWRNQRSLRSCSMAKGWRVKLPCSWASSQVRFSENSTLPVILALYSEEPKSGAWSVMFSSRGRAKVPDALACNDMGPVTSISRGIFSRSAATARATSGTCKESS